MTNVSENNELTVAGGGFPLRIPTYDYLCIISHELQASPPVVNAVARVAAALFPHKVEFVERGFIPNMWMNRILVQTANGEYMLLDTGIWYDTYYYLVNLAGVNVSDYRYDPKSKMPFQQWFEKKIMDEPYIELQTEKTYDDIHKEVTREYVDIMTRLSISIYVLDAFGSGPRETIRQNLQAQSLPTTSSQ